LGASLTLAFVCLWVGEGVVAVKTGAISPSLFLYTYAVGGGARCASHARTRMATRLRPKVLFVWDFDYTFILDNSDTFIPAFFNCAAAQSALTRVTPTQSWNAMVDDALQVLQRQGHSRSDIERACGHFPYDVETVEIVRRANARGIPCHIISDSNTTFISSFLRSLPPPSVEFASVETHPTYTDDAGLLRLLPVHAHSCDLCPVQMCKVR